MAVIFHKHYIMVSALGWEKASDMRQNEGRIKFIKVGDALGTEASSRKS